MPERQSKTMEESFDGYIASLQETDLATRLKSLNDVARLAARQRELQEIYEDDIGVSTANAVAVRFISIAMNTTRRVPDTMEVSEPFLVVRYMNPQVNFAVDGDTLDLWWEENGNPVLVTNRELTERLIAALTPPDDQTPDQSAPSDRQSAH